MDLEVVLHVGDAGLTRELRFGAPAEPSTYVFGNELLPAVSAIAFDPDTRAIEWTESGSLVGADGMFLHLGGGGADAPRRWTVVAPPDVGSPFRLPALPPELEAYRPHPGDRAVAAGVVAFDLDWIAGTDDFVAHFALRLLEDPCIPDSYATTARLTQAGVFYGPDLRAGGY
jgi:hypothetical protein